MAWLAAGSHLDSQMSFAEVLDWTGPNNRLHQATQAIQHSTTMHLHILPRIMKLESRVRKIDIRLFDSPNPFLSRLMMWSGSGTPMGLKSVVLRWTPRRVVRDLGNHQPD